MLFHAKISGNLLHSSVYTDDRSSESDSVTNQRKLIENFIERNPDIEIISEKIDDGYSGIIFDRPALRK